MDRIRATARKGVKTFPETVYTSREYLPLESIEDID